MGSSRLPGKVLAKLGGRTVLAHCLSRATAVPGADAVCLATSELAIDDPVAEAAAQLSGVTVFRGHATDVLARYADAARATSADIILRITCDCPLIDPVVCGEVLALRAKTGASYASNNLTREWPHGLDCEAFTRQALDAADRAATDSYDREHVGPWMRRAAGAAAAHLPGPGAAAARHRWTLDYPQDLAFLLALWPHLPADRISSWRDVIAALDRHPEIVKINEKLAVAG
jgi:spore coat polysaccharide biosynthesis protein SpsF